MKFILTGRKAQVAFWAMSAVLYLLIGGGIAFWATLIARAVRG